MSGLGHELPEARVAALGAALRLGLLDADTLAQFFDDPADQVRYRAVELAAREPAIGVGLSDRLVAALDDDALSEVAAFALGEVELSGPRRDAALAALGRQATEHEDALCRESAVAALGALRGGLDHILAATSDVATVRRRAVLALAPFDGPEVDEALRRALEDRDWQVRQAAEDLRPEPEDAP